MCVKQLITSVSLVALGAFLSCEPALAQQVTGAPGSPSATTTIEGSQLPPHRTRANSRLFRLTSTSDDFSISSDPSDLVIFMIAP
jgi:hypothetical protein